MQPGMSGSLCNLPTDQSSAASIEARTPESSFLDITAHIVHTKHLLEGLNLIAPAGGSCLTVSPGPATAYCPTSGAAARAEVSTTRRPSSSLSCVRRKKRFQKLKPTQSRQLEHRQFLADALLHIQFALLPHCRMSRLEAMYLAYTSETHHKSPAIMLAAPLADETEPCFLAVPIPIGVNVMQRGPICCKCINPGCCCC